MSAYAGIMLPPTRATLQGACLINAWWRVLIHDLLRVAGFAHQAENQQHETPRIAIMAKVAKNELCDAATSPIMNMKSPVRVCQ